VTPGRIERGRPGIRKRFAVFKVPRLGKGSAMITYLFHAEGKPGGHGLDLNTGDDSRVLEWLLMVLKDVQPDSLTVGPPNARISRAVVRDPNTPENPGVAGVAVEWPDGERIGITKPTARKWAEDLAYGKPGVYDAVSASAAVPIREPSD
jgi:hypothetical protein